MDTHEQFTFLFGPSRFQEVCTRYTKDIYNGPRLKTHEQAAHPGEADTHTHAHGEIFMSTTGPGKLRRAEMNLQSLIMRPIGFCTGQWPLHIPSHSHSHSHSPTCKASAQAQPHPQVFLYLAVIFFCTTRRMCLLRCFLSALAAVHSARPRIRSNPANGCRSLDICICAIKDSFCGCR